MSESIDQWNTTRGYPPGRLILVAFISSYLSRTTLLFALRVREFCFCWVQFPQNCTCMFLPPIASIVWGALEVLNMPYIINMIPLGVPWHEKWIGRMWNRMIETRPFKHRTHHLVNLRAQKGNSTSERTHWAACLCCGGVMASHRAPYG